MAKKEKYIEVGFTAIRDPATGEFLKSVPLYIKADDSAIAAEKNLIHDISNVLARQFKAYVDGCREAGVPV